MTCRHKPGDPNCSSNRDYVSPGTYSMYPATPDSTRYDIIDYQRVGPNVVMKVQYPNCKSCAYEGSKVMVFLNVTEVDLIKWREIDPHFRDPKVKNLPNKAPSPAARFPASPEGWKDALAYAKRKADDQAGDERLRL